MAGRDASGRRGDGGATSLADGSRVRKDAQRVCALGAADEAQAALGLARALARRQDTAQAALDAELALARAMASLAKAEAFAGAVAFGDADVEALDRAIERFERELPDGFSFDVPGSTAASAAFHVARTVVRRFERDLVALSDVEQVAPALLAFANRLSTLCYALALLEAGEQA